MDSGGGVFGEGVGGGGEEEEEEEEEELPPEAWLRKDRQTKHKILPGVVRTE